ncbi:MAG: cell division protein FtsA [Verrucomicrobiales bacterium]|jgi:cell division protein FtsA
MARSKIYVGLEIGTSKICVVVGEVRPDSGIKILGVGQSASRGVRKGEIIDFETVQTCLHDALVKAEERSDLIIEKVMLAISGAHITSTNNRGCVRIPSDQNEITEDDLDEVKEIARDVQIPQSHAFLHSIVRHYFVDGQEKVLNPVGMLGQKLEADYHIIHGIRTRIQNTIRCVREVPLEVDDIVFSPLAAAQVIVSRLQKEQGALVIDMGGGTTDYVLYHDGAVVASGCVGLGGDHITNDISIVCKLPLQTAEQLKTKQGSVYFDARRIGKEIEVPAGRGFSGATIEENVLNQVIHLRVKEILEIIRERLEQTGFLQKISAGVFLTGGCSLLDGIADLGKSVFKMPVQRGAAESLSGMRATFENPQFATAIGLIRYAQLLDHQQPARGALATLGSKIGGWLKVNR